MLRAALVTPLSGPLARYGRAGADALALWAESLGGAGADLSVHDAHPDARAAVARATAQEPDLLFGPYGSRAIGEVLDATGRVVFNHGAAHVPGDARNVVSVLAPARTYLEGTLRAVAAAAPGTPHRVAVAHGAGGFARAVAAGAVAETERQGWPVATTTLPGAAADGDLLLVAGRFADELCAARAELGRSRHAAAFVGAGVDEVLAALGPDREGLLGPAQWLASAAAEPDLGPSAGAFAAAYRARTGTEPPYPAAQAFAGGLVAERCLSEAGAADDATVLAAARRLTCTTMFGAFRLDPRSGRQAGHTVLTVQWQDGVRHVVWPPERAQAALRVPLRR